MTVFTRAPRWLLALYAITLIYCLLLVLNLAPILRIGGPGGEWFYALPRPGWALALIIGLGVYCSGALRLLEHSLRLLLWSFVWSVILPLLVAALRGPVFYEMFARVASYVQGGYLYASTLADDLPNLLYQWPALVERFRATTHLFGGVAIDPPGITAPLVAIERLLDNAPALTGTFAPLLRPLQCQDLVLNTWTDSQYTTGLLQMAMPLWAALTLAPLRTFGRAIFGEQTTRYAIALWPLLPGMAMFAPRFNTIYPLIALTMMLFLWRGILKRRPALVFVAGLIASVGTFINLSLAPLGILGGFWIIGLCGREVILREQSRTVTLRQVVRQSAVALLLFGIGSALLWIIYQLFTGISIVDILRLSLSEHFSTRGGEHGYIYWLLQNPFDMFLFLGLPIAFLSLWRITRARERRSFGDLFALVMGVSFGLLVLSTAGRGETGRVWLFFSPFWVLLAADRIASMSAARSVLRRILPAQAATLASMACVLWVVFTALTQPAYPPASSTTPTFPIDARFDSGAFTLVGVSTASAPGMVELRLNWRAESWIRDPIELSILPVAPDGKPRPAINLRPMLASTRPRAGRRDAPSMMWFG